MLRKILPYTVCVFIAAAAFFAGKYSGANLVRDGLVANYPLFKNIVSNTVTEKDSTLSLNVLYKDQNDLFALLGLKESDSLLLHIPYHAIYGQDLNSKYFRVSQTKNLIEVYLPKSYVRTYYINFHRVSANGKNIDKNSSENAKKLLNEMVIIPLNKDRAVVKAANTKIAEAVMWLFVPYKFELKMFFDNQTFPLPEVVGLNKDVDAFIKENIGK